MGSIFWDVCTPASTICYMSCLLRFFLNGFKAHSDSNLLLWDQFFSFSKISSALAAVAFVILARLSLKLSSFYASLLALFVTARSVLVMLRAVFKAHLIRRDFLVCIALCRYLHDMRGKRARWYKNNYVYTLTPRLCPTQLIRKNEKHNTLHWTAWFYFITVSKHIERTRFTGEIDV